MEEKTQQNRQEKNPIDYFFLASGELEQARSLLDLVQANPPLIKKQYLSQVEPKAEVTAKQNFVDLKNRRNTLLEGAKRLRSFAEFAKKR